MSGLGWVDILPSHHTVRIGVGPVDGWSPGSATSQLSLPPPLPLPGLLSFVRVGRPRPELVVPRGLRHRQTQTSTSADTDTDTDSELLSLRARWLLFDSHRGHTLVPKWADTHTRTASFRALSHTGFVTTGPTLTFTYTYALFVDNNVWNSHCDGAYPQPQWDCACSAYKSAS